MIFLECDVEGCKATKRIEIIATLHEPPDWSMLTRFEEIEMPPERFAQMIEGPGGQIARGVAVSANRPKRMVHRVYYICPNHTGQGLLFKKGSGCSDDPELLDSEVEESVG